MSTAVKSKCRAKHPQLCPYHGLLQRMEEAIAEQDYQGYEYARKKLERYQSEEGKKMMSPMERMVHLTGPGKNFPAQVAAVESDYELMKQQIAAESKKRAAAAAAKVKKPKKVETLADVEKLLPAASRHGLYGRPAWSRIVDLGDGEFLLSTPREEGDRWTRWTTWYRRGGRNVAMINMSRVPNSKGENEFTLCDIEVREDAQGQGLGLKMVRLMEKHGFTDGTPMMTTGGYTPEGIAALGKHLPLNTTDSHGSAAIHYGSMTFVKDWEAMYVD